MTRILAIGSMYPPHHAGGYELLWQATMRHARAKGHRVRVLASDYRDPAVTKEQDPDVHRTLRWYWDLARYQFVNQERIARLQVERHNARELQRHLRGFTPDIVTWWSMGCMSLSLIEHVRRAGIPAALIVIDDWLVYGWKFDAWMNTWRGKRSLAAPVAERLLRIPIRVDVNAAGSLVFCSRYTLERARQQIHEMSRAMIVYPGADSAFLDLAPPKPWRWRMAYVGRLDRHKGVDTAVAALAHLPAEATLKIFGSGDEEYIAEMKQLAQRVGVAERVMFDGFARDDSLRSAYADADVVVFPVRWEEPFGLVPLEAMAVGCPVVSTARGGTAEFVRDGHNALVFAADDAAGLAACIARLAHNEPLRRRLRDGGRQTASVYTLQRFTSQTMAHILSASNR